jgi:hypothetical protein
MSQDDFANINKGIHYHFEKIKGQIEENPAAEEEEDVPGITGGRGSGKDDEMGSGVGGEEDDDGVILTMRS